MSSNELMLQVEVVDGGEVVDTHEFTDQKIKVGQLASSQLYLDDPKVSRIHAVFEDQGDGTYQVIDLGSASGTYINGEKTTKGVVGDGDEVRFGDTTVQLTVVDLAARRRAEKEAAAARTAETEEVPEGHIQLEDGTVVEPFTLEGYYDDAGNYIPGYYDETGQYHYGYGYYDEGGTWQVAHGFYDPEGEWVPTSPPEGEKPSDTELYTEQFFSDRGGRSLEIAHLWSDAVVDVQNYARPRTVLIGTSDDNDYVLQDKVFKHPRFPLVMFDGEDGYRLVFTTQMKGTVQRQGEQYSLQEMSSRGLARPSDQIDGAYTFALTRDTSVRVDFGRNTFLIHFADIPEAVVGASFGLEGAPFFYQSVSLGLHVAFMMLVFMFPDNYGAMELYGHDVDDRFAEMELEPEEEEEEEEELDEDLLEDAEEPEEAEAPDEDEVEDEDLELEGDEEVDDEMQAAREEEIARDHGALAAFEGQQQDAIADGAANILADMDADHSGDGIAGMGPTGGATLGGAEGDGHGHVGVGTEGGPGGAEAPDADLDDRDTLEPEVVPQEPETEGALDREIIQRVVRQNRREIQHCYEQELNRNPDLSGQITMQWVISPGGDVVNASVEDTTMNSHEVEQCMAGRIQRWSFPEPEGGGIVRVNYPFNFTS